jgi:hypothetical protein
MTAWSFPASQPAVPATLWTTSILLECGGADDPTSMQS